MALVTPFFYIMDLLIRKLDHLIKAVNPSIMFEVIAKKNDLGGLIVYLNTQRQLFDKGINSKGIKLEDIGGAYSPATINGTSKYKGKIELGLPIDRITLYNSGEFYKTFNVEVENNGDLLIRANPHKDGNDLFSRWGEDIVGLTENNLDLVRKALKGYIIKYILDQYEKG